MESQHYLVPEQTEGIKKDLDYTVRAESADDADDWFVDAKNRLLDVNNWRKYSETLKTEFKLTDTHGKVVNRHAHKGDHIRIDLPGPGSTTGEGYDWVIVEAIEYDDYPDIDTESIAIRLRPTASPVNNDSETAHFFGSGATSTMVVVRAGKVLTAWYHGRNEVPNTEGNAVDTARNAAVATGAMLGLSEVQWSGLIKGLLDS